MTYWAIVPVKPLRRAKSRLAGVMSEDDREALSQKLMHHTLDVLHKLPAIESTLVVSRDTQALALARKAGARTLTEHGAPELNQALVRATMVAMEYGATGILVLPADLPLLTIEDLQQLLEAAHDPPVVVVVPDRHEMGTNALLVRPSGLMVYDFGEGSFHRHLERAQTMGARVEIVKNPTLGLDLDLPEDLERLQEKIGLEGFIPMKEGG